MSGIWDGVRRVIRDAETGGITVGMAIIPPAGPEFRYQGDEPVRAASTIKIAIMIELFRRVDDGGLALDDPYVLRAADKAPGSGVLQHLHDGIGLTLGDVAYLMMSISDNAATNILIDHLGFEAINATMREMGLRQSVLGRKMMGRPAQGAEQENLATPGEMARIVGAILDGTAASPDSCERMIGLLELQQNARRIGRYLPDGVRWGSKTGSYDTVANDAGFVMLDDGPLVISAFTSNLPDMVEGELVLSELAREAVCACGGPVR